MKTGHSLPLDLTQIDHAKSTTTDKTVTATHAVWWPDLLIDFVEWEMWYPKMTTKLLENNETWQKYILTLSTFSIVVFPWYYSHNVKSNERQIRTIYGEKEEILSDTVLDKPAALFDNSEFYLFGLQVPPRSRAIPSFSRAIYNHNIMREWRVQDVHFLLFLWRIAVYPAHPRIKKIYEHCISYI